MRAGPAAPRRRQPARAALALSDLDHSCAFTIVEGPIPVVNYLSELPLRRVTADETTFVEWVGQFDVADADEVEVCNTVMTMFHAGLEALADHFAPRDR